MNAATDHTGRGPRYLVLLARLVVTSMVLGLVAVSPAHGAGNSLNAKTCQKGGWATVVTTTGAKFANEEACVGYAAKGGTLKRAQTVSFTSDNPSPVTVGTAYTPAASATSGLPVTITIDPASSSICSKSGAVVTFDTAGTCTIDASQSGNTAYDAAAQMQQSITVTNPVNPSQAVCEANGGTFGLGSVWSCQTLPTAVGSDFSPLQNQCQADGGVGFVAMPTLAGGYDTWCFATALDALLFAVSGAVQAVLIATWNA